MGRPIKWMLVWNNIFGFLWTINRMTGCSGYPLQSLLRIMEYPSQRSVLHFLQFKAWFDKCPFQGSQHRSEINNAWMRIKFKLRCNRFLNICWLKCDGVRRYKKGGANRECIPAPNIQIGSKVSLDARNVRTTPHTRKLDWKRLGPFWVYRWASSYAYKLELSASIWFHRVQRVSLLDTVIEDPMVG